MGYQSTDIDARDTQDLVNAFEMADNIVLRKYINTLQELDLEVPNKEFIEKELSKEIRMFRINKLIYDKDENNIQKLTNFYTMAAGLKANVFVFVDSDGDKVDYYMGVCNEEKDSSLRFKIESLYGGLVGNFPGSLNGLDKDMITDDEVEDILKCSFDERVRAVSSVSGVASIRNERIDDNQNFIQGIEKLIDTMRGNSFSVIFIANPISKEEMANIKVEFENLYTSLVPFLKSQMSFNESHMEGISNSLSKSMAKSYGTSKSTSLSVGTNESTSKTKGWSVGANAGTSSSVTNGLSVGATLIGGPFLASVVKSVSNTLTNSFGVNGSVSGSKTKTKGTSTNNTETDSTNESETNTDTTTEGTNSSDSKGLTLQIEYENKNVKQLMEKIDEQLKRIKQCECFGVFAVAAYFMGGDRGITNMAASNYKSLISGTNTSAEASHINTWDDVMDIAILKEYIKRFYHPQFKLYCGDNLNYVTPVSLVSGQELAIQMGLPKRSVAGVTVTDCAAFGRNIFKLSGDKYENTITLGNIYHMRSQEKASVKLSIKDLSMHTFITGSTGAGKSNTIYNILKKLDDEDINFMVVEPAKGEYKHVFGHRKDVTVLGTNPKKNKMLKVNPFYFPEDIHILEHIDKLIEIFNVCWPMYAAMPAVLKEAVERAYEVCGWSLDESINYVNENIYPTFKDVLSQLIKVIEESDFSEEVKSNYIGALVTRVKSLTNGINGRIFVGEDIDNNILFDTNVIIDLSRVGSTETKAMIMGILVMKLQEYRMSEGGVNKKLKHITVLEEAHNLLKKTSTSQGGEGGNLAGKSVEMLSNIIAEIRTYGEGFIIADQAPGLLDESVIRNTNTKIILRLPDYNDRELVGRAANLNENQIIELAKLPVGVAAVYHNDWIEPVLCKVEEFKSKGQEFEFTLTSKEEVDGKIDILKTLVACKEDNENLDYNIDKLIDMVTKVEISSELKLKIIECVKGKRKIDDFTLSTYVNELFNGKKAFIIAKEASNIKEWNEILLDSIDPILRKLDEKYQNIVIKSMLIERAKEDIYFEEMKLKWLNYMTRRSLI